MLYFQTKAHLVPAKNKFILKYFNSNNKRLEDPLDHESIKNARNKKKNVNSNKRKK